MQIAQYLRQRLARFRYEAQPINNPHLRGMLAFRVFKQNRKGRCYPVWFEPWELFGSDSDIEKIAEKKITRALNFLEGFG